MRFARNTMPHEAYHNLYGNLMAQATLDGLRAARPDARPFILTRSASTGTQQLCAVWTGDNASNPAHLAMSIPMSINLALSGISFNGPDVGGFMEDVSEELLVTWMLAGGLFPFLRNHSCAGTRRQEPYMFQPQNLDLMRRVINTRTKLLPYLYNEFVRHAETGDAVMRPLSYEFDDPRCERIGDQFLIGPSLMTAPFTKLKENERDVYLPGGWWFDLRTGEWLEGGRAIKQPFDRRMSLYVRDGSIIPTLAGDDHFPQPDFSRLEFHVFCKDIQKASYLYQEDDGETLGWQRGQRNRQRIEFDAAEGLRLTSLEQGYRNGAKLATFHYHGLSPKTTSPGECRWPFGALQTVSENRSLGTDD
jgi:alpha-glucosidase